MPFFYPQLDIPPKEKKIPRHPWEKTIKEAYTGIYKYAHNSVRNPVYPPPKKGRVPCSERIKFTVIGTLTEKEFIYCMKLVKGLHKYRWKHFDAPVIMGLTTREWARSWTELKIKYGGEAYCLKTQVAVIKNDEFLGGEKELKELIESKYIYHIKPDYYAEANKLFSNFLKSTGRPTVYFEILIDGTSVGTMIFMLYSDIVPYTCENFLRICKETKGGYSGTPIHRIVRDSWIQAGGFGLKETDLTCENFIVPHDKRGVIAMANDGRHVDCSTQFFVLLQPQNWMAHKYVAFGQLISGDETLKKIEQVPVWYESPEKEIIIAKAGILNLECQDITINKGTNKYLEGHTENLIAIGEIFYEELMQNVFLEAQFRSLQRIQDEMILGEGEITSEEVAQNIRTTQRFMRKKEEIDKQIEKAQSGKATPAGTDKGENNDFDVEEYEYTPEEYSYRQATAVGTASLIVPPEMPYYIPLTDVPYPGEVSSEFDLKRLLQGDYCLEGDIDGEANKRKKKGDDLDRLDFHSQILAQMFDMKSTESDSSENSLDSEEEKEITQYLQDNVDRVSFAGGVIKTIARSVKHTNIFAAEKVNDLVPDEALRRYRMAEELSRRAREKKVSITVPDETPDIRKEIIRRQTGFVRPEDLTRMRQFERHDDDDEDLSDAELDDYLPYTRQVSIHQPSLTSHKTASRKKSDSASPQQKGPLAKTIHEMMKETIKGDSEKKQASGHYGIKVDSSGSVPKMLDLEERRAQGPGAYGVGWRSGSDFRASRMSDDDVEKRHSDFGDDKRRMSVLTRLIDDVTTDESQGPTLKDYHPISERQQKNTLFLLTYSPEKYADLTSRSGDPRELYLRRRRSLTLTMTHPRHKRKSIDHILRLQHGKRVYRKISTDYVRTIDKIEKKEETSLRSLEYAKHRPSISVKEYQKQNRAYNEAMAKKPKAEVKKKIGSS